MKTSTRMVLSVLTLAVAYAVLMNGVVGSYEFLALFVLLTGTLFLIWRSGGSHSSR